MEVAGPRRRRGARRTRPGTPGVSASHRGRPPCEHRRGGAARCLHLEGRQPAAGGGGRHRISRSPAHSRSPTARSRSGSRWWSLLAISRDSLVRTVHGQRGRARHRRRARCLADHAPVLLPGFPNPIQLALTLDVHESVATVGSSARAFTLCSKPAPRPVIVASRPQHRRAARPRLHSGGSGSAPSRSPLRSRSIPTPTQKDRTPRGPCATIVPPDGLSQTSRPRDLIFVLDRSGSMEGWKMVAGATASARMVDTLGVADRFNVFAFDNQIERPWVFGSGTGCGE